MMGKNWEHLNTAEVRRGIWEPAALRYSRGKQIRAGGSSAGLRRSRREEIGRRTVALAR